MNILSFLGAVSAPNDLWVKLMNWVKGAVGNLGWTIILVTLLVKVVTTPLDFFVKLSTKKQTLKANIKKHILAVEKAKVLFDEYEKLAVQIEEFDKPKKSKTQNKDSESATKHDKKSAKDEYKDEIIA
jgi:membrane protein insertase Oxa1/YidC/SpoIIIJ